MECCLPQGLFRSASQLKQADFLARDFKQQKHQQAACKNAFVLLGQHKYELAAAFFILGDSFYVSCRLKIPVDNPLGLLSLLI